MSAIKTEGKKNSNILQATTKTAQMSRWPLTN